MNSDSPSKKPPLERLAGFVAAAVLWTGFGVLAVFFLSPTDLPSSTWAWAAAVVVGPLVYLAADALLHVRMFGWPRAAETAPQRVLRWGILFSLVAGLSLAVIAAFKWAVSN